MHTLYCCALNLVSILIHVVCDLGDDSQSRRGIPGHDVRYHNVANEQRQGEKRFRFRVANVQAGFERHFSDSVQFLRQCTHEIPWRVETLSCFLGSLTEFRSERCQNHASWLDATTEFSVISVSLPLMRHEPILTGPLCIRMELHLIGQPTVKTAPLCLVALGSNSSREIRMTFGLSVINHPAPSIPTIPLHQ
jgi:hypothetical protein